MTTAAYLQSSVMLNSSIEEQLLLCCACTHVDQEVAKHIRQLLQQPIDWEQLIEIANYHQIIPLLYRNLQQVDSELIPEVVINQLQNLNFTNVVFSLSLTSKLLEILTWFAVENIDVIPYKGSVLGAAVYGDICLRQFHDLDLLIAPTDVTTAEKLLMAQDYQLGEQYPWEQSFIHPNQGINIDLHQGLAQSYYPFRLEFADCVQRSQSVDLLDSNVQSFSWEDLLLVLSLQVVKDSYNQVCILAKVCDIAELVQQHPTLSWELVIDRAQSIGCQRLLAIALFLTHKLFGITLPASIWQIIGQDWVVKKYGKMLANNFFHPETSGVYFMVFKVLLLIEYPLSAPHNTHLLKEILTYPHSKLAELRNFN